MTKTPIEFQFISIISIKKGRAYYNCKSVLRMYEHNRVYVQI